MKRLAAVALLLPVLAATAPSKAPTAGWPLGVPVFVGPPGHGVVIGEAVPRGHWFEFRP